MPTYRYKCDMCGKEEDIFLPISSDPNKPLPCPECGLELMTRRISNKHTFVCNQSETLGKWYKRKTGKELLGGE